jgi:secreted PhoX family phosphatase
VVGYKVATVIAWGDPLAPGIPGLDPSYQTAERQRHQFGYNADGLWFFPLPIGSRNSNAGVIAANHEFTSPELMFPTYDPRAPTKEQVDVEIAAHGLAFVEIRQNRDGDWEYERASAYNRRVTGETIMQITGPAAGHELLRTSADGIGALVHGTLNNCSAGGTPWGTILTCEENFHQYFSNLIGVPDADPRKEIHRRYGLPEGASERGWERYYDRFDTSKEPNEPFRFGWVVEIDPYDPFSQPRKRTALGRFCHEAATVKVAADNRVALYMGDDAPFEHAYKFVTTGTYNAANRTANSRLLDDGVLYAARFADDGTGEWLPLVFGQGPLTARNGFHSQGDVLIDTRRAADLLGATKMDRPEDIEPNPANGKIYAVMTNNRQRTEADIEAANPRANNVHGHILEISENGSDAAATRFRWEIFLLCGNPASSSDGMYAAGFDVSGVSAISTPDNIAFDSNGNLWIATDGQTNTLGLNDGVYVVPTGGTERGRVRQVLSGVPGAEVSGLAFTPNDETLFVSIQHPGEGSTYADPTSFWPDGHTPPRPGVVALTRTAYGAPPVGVDDPIFSRGIVG